MSVREFCSSRRMLSDALTGTPSLPATRDRCLTPSGRHPNGSGDGRCSPRAAGTSRCRCPRRRGGVSRSLGGGQGRSCCERSFEGWGGFSRGERGRLRAGPRQNAGVTSAIFRWSDAPGNSTSAGPGGHRVPHTRAGRVIPGWDHAGWRGGIDGSPSGKRLPALRDAATAGRGRCDDRGNPAVRWWRRRRGSEHARRSSGAGSSRITVSWWTSGTCSLHPSGRRSARCAIVYRPCGSRAGRAAPGQGTGVHPAGAADTAAACARCRHTAAPSARTREHAARAPATVSVRNRSCEVRRRSSRRAVSAGPRAGSAPAPGYSSGETKVTESRRRPPEHGSSIASMSPGGIGGQ